MTVTTMSDQIYAPPSHLPPPKPLLPVELPGVHPDDVSTLSMEGWTKVNYEQAFESAFRDLLDASEGFFNLPLKEKMRYKGQISELGWCRVEGEKELITLRDLVTTPDCLKEPAKRYWSICGHLLNSMLVKVAESLQLPAEALTAFSEPCINLQEEKTATMLRLFRYDTALEDGHKVVAQPHSDLGLLSLVVGDTPGLEVWERVSQTYYPIEIEFVEPAAAVLCGTELARLTNFRYIPGGHRVVAYPKFVSNPPTRRHPAHRFSIVYILRAHYPVRIDTDNLTTPITGTFQKPMKGINAGDLFKQISSSHYNINIDKAERERQRQRLNKIKEQQAQSTGKSPPSLEEEPVALQYAFFST